MMYFFGRKGRAAYSYPAPDYPLVIEPFAGSMAYSLHWRPRMAIGIERDGDVAALWWRLCDMSAADIREFPAPEVGSTTTDRWVITAIASNGSNGVTYRKVTPFVAANFEKQRRLALRHHDYARRSVLFHRGDYRDAPDVEATWYIDPPYTKVPGGYRGKAELDYDELAAWCLSRRGQVIVCEGRYGRWLPFEAHGSWSPMFTRTSRPIEERVLVHRTHRRCAQCDVTFPAARADARFCSPRCRQRASRASRDTDRAEA